MYIYIGICFTSTAIIVIGGVGSSCILLCGSGDDSDGSHRRCDDGKNGNSNICSVKNMQ